MGLILTQGIIAAVSQGDDNNGDIVDDVLFGLPTFGALLQQGAACLARCRTARHDVHSLLAVNKLPDAIRRYNQEPVRFVACRFRDLQ